MDQNGGTGIRRVTLVGENPKLINRFKSLIENSVEVMNFSSKDVKQNGLSESEILILMPKIDGFPETLKKLSEGFKIKPPIIISFCLDHTVNSLLSYCTNPPGCIFKCVETGLICPESGYTIAYKNKNNLEKDEKMAVDFIRRFYNTIIWEEDEDALIPYMKLSKSACVLLQKFVLGLSAAGERINLGTRENLTNLLYKGVAATGKILVEQNINCEILKERVSTPGGLTMACMKQLISDDIDGDIKHIVRVVAGDCDKKH